MRLLFILFICVSSSIYSQNPHWQNEDSSLKGTALLTDTVDMSIQMLKGINTFFDHQLAVSKSNRKAYWHSDFTDSETYIKSVSDNRRSFAQMVGIVDSMEQDVVVEYIATPSMSAISAENEYFIAYAVRWKLFDNVYGEGLLLQPKNEIKARIVAIPDADQTPEMLIGTDSGLSPEMQYARHLAENGCQVLIPTIINRRDSISGSDRLNRFTNQPHREWIYRQAFTFGRHVIGYEVQKVMAAVDWFDQQNKQRDLPIAVVGWGEGGLLGFYSAAIDNRIDAALISGYFGNRDSLWQEPIYRNVFGLLREFGDAEIASLIAPRKLIIEYAPFPDIEGPPPPRNSSGGRRLTASAAPGRIITPSFAEVNSEVMRARELLGQFGNSIDFLHDNGRSLPPLGLKSIAFFLNQLDIETVEMPQRGRKLSEERRYFNPEARQHRQVVQLEQYTQGLIPKSRHVRDAYFWDKTSITTTDAWRDSMKYYQQKLWNDVIGRIPSSSLPLNPRSRKIMDEPLWAGFEVTLDVLPEVNMWGYLLLPKNIKSGEKRPVIVVQHGGSGLPKDVIDPTNKTYKALAVQLVENGYIVFAPHFPWRGGTSYRDIQRKANPLGLSIFSIILNQHERLLAWLGSQPWADPDQIGLYGLSWGGKVAMRVPALLEGYSLSICSGDFNEWIWKNATTDWQNSYMYVPEYEMFDFNLGRTFNYGEMAALIAPRAFMVERGHDDGVGVDEWVSFEYAKVRRLYDKLDIPQKTRIEYFNGGHEINAKGTFEFIRQNFDWVSPE